MRVNLQKDRLARGSGRLGPGRWSGFTMIEIAIALAVIAFALVAIIGILPSGLQVQKESREKTVINTDAKYFLNAIKNGVRDLQDLPSFVEGVETVLGVYTNGVDYVEGWEVVGLLSTPGTNVAVVQAVTGTAVSRGSVGKELAFRYRLRVELVPMERVDPGDASKFILDTNLWDIRLEFGWPLLANGEVGREREVFRGLAAARVENDPPGSSYFFLKR